MKLRNLFSFADFFVVLKRDYLSVVSSVIAFLISMELVWSDIQDEDSFVIWMFTVASGISLFLATRLLAKNNKERIQFSAIAAVALIGFGFYASYNRDSGVQYNFLHWFLITHLLVAVAPLRHGSSWRSRDMETNAWRFNWYLLTRFVFGIVFCLLMLGGLCAALLAIAMLFTVEINSKVYSTVCLFVLFVVSVFQVLSTITDTKIGPQSHQVTTDLRRLVQYLFTPLSIIYFAIAYAYIVKILLRWQWPQGVVGWLVSILTVVVFLSFTIQRPLTDVKTFPQWMQKFWQWSFALLIAPLLVLLVAVWLRIKDYGLTESRVLLVILSLWAFGVTIYLMKPHKKSLVMIPVSLLMVMVVTFIGPLSPRFLSYQSQKRQFKEITYKYNGKFLNGKFLWESLPEPSDASRLKSILNYLCTSHDPELIFSLTGLPRPDKKELKKIEDCNESVSGSEIRLVFEKMQLENVSVLEEVSAYLIDEGPYWSQDFQESDLSFWIEADNLKSIEFGQRKLQFTYNCCGTNIIWNTESKEKISIDLLPLMRKNQPGYFKSKSGTLSLWVKSAYATRDKNGWHLNKDVQLKAFLMRNGQEIKK